MATAAPSPLASSVEKTNGAKLSRLLIDGGTTVLKNVFDVHHPPAHLVAGLKANKTKLNNLLKIKVLYKTQWNKLFPPSGAAPDSNTFDITLFFLLLTNICGLSPPPSGWHTKPPQSDTSHEANLARVKFYRNVLYGHVTSTGVDTPTFSALWTEISAVLVGLGLDQAEVDRLKVEKGGEQDYLDALLEWAKSEEDIKSQLRNIQQFQTNTQQVVEEMRQTQTETKEAVKEVLHTQTKTQLTVEEVRQTQTKTKEAVKEVLQTQTKTQLTVEEVRETQTETKEAVKEVLHTQTKTQLTVEEVRQTQTEAKQVVEEVHQSQAKIQQTVEQMHQTMKEVRQTQTKTEQTVEEVCQTQTKTGQTVEEVAVGLQEVKEAVNNLKEGREKDRTDEVLRNLAKSEFRGDIEFYAERFQADTREWEFDTFQNWLDDRSSQNRVMVISGNAGMGKSVIAAVICKRMQEADRLSGSHFCQHNNVRYCKPRLMLQSLACHLSHTLPEYRQALVEQLSRNLGVELNNMGVEELFSLLFKEPLSAVGDPGRNLLMVIDGLDESEYQGRNELLEIIANQFCKLPTWIRFLVTTRPATNIAVKLMHLKPFELQSNDKKNREDVKTFFEKKLQRVKRLENVDALVEKLVSKSEGLMLYAHFLILFINENPTVLNQGDLDGSLPLGISSFYHSYFKRLENELTKELAIKEEHFLNLLCAISASREPLPTGFVSKVLAPRSNSLLAKRKLLKALDSISAVLPIRNGCLHVIHKSVKDWLTDVSCYGEHEFIIGENERQRILANLCADELDCLKRKGVDNVEFSATEKYALYHGARHMLHPDVRREPHKREELTKAYVTDLEIVYAKTCVNSTTAAEDLVWLWKQGISTVLSESSQSILKTLLFLLRKYLDTFRQHPRVFLQTVLNEGGKVLSADALNLLQSKYSEIPYMEYLRKVMRQQGGVVARFHCSSCVLCLDVSPALDFMVCECWDGMLQLWSLHSGRLVWTRPVKITKNYESSRKSRSSSVSTLYRSVVFHPTNQIVLPGILSHAYTIDDGDLKPLFPGSNCSFSVCSISGDKTKILTNCPNNAKCLVMWSLENGSEIDRITRNEDVLSFAWSRDGRLLAVSHSNRSICLLDVMDGFRTLVLTATPRVCGMLRFSCDHRFLFFLHRSRRGTSWFCCYVNTRSNHNFSLEFSSRYIDHADFKSLSDCGFLFGDLISVLRMRDGFSFVLSKQSLLRCHSTEIEMLNTDEVSNSSEERAHAVTLSLDGQTVYVVSFNLLTAWNVSRGDHIAKKSIMGGVHPVPVREGILIKTANSILELWNRDLSECVQWWIDCPRITKMIPISEERVGCVQEEEEEGEEEEEEKVNVLDTTSGEIVSTIPVLHGRIITCNSKCQLLSVDRSITLRLSDDKTILWENHSLHPDLKIEFVDCFNVVFSPLEQFLVISIDPNVYVLDAVTGNTLHNLRAGAGADAVADAGWSLRRIFRDPCAFVSDEECVFGCNPYFFKLFNVKSGDLLSVIDVEAGAICLAACPRKRLIAIGLGDSAPNFRVLQVRLPRDKDTRKSKR